MTRKAKKKGVYLKFADINDVDFFLRLKNDCELQDLLMCPTQDYKLNDILNWIERYQKSQDSFLIVIQNEDSKSIGYISIQKYLRNNGTAYFGIAIDRTYRSVGYGMLSLGALFDFGKNKLDLRKILLEVAVDNKKAIHLYEKINFRKVGILKNHFSIRDSIFDAVLMEYELNKEMFL